jgi:hypothetical protein
MLLWLMGTTVKNQDFLVGLVRHCLTEQNMLLTGSTVYPQTGDGLHPSLPSKHPLLIVLAEQRHLIQMDEGGSGC